MWEGNFIIQFRKQFKVRDSRVCYDWGCENYSSWLNDVIVIVLPHDYMREIRGFSYSQKKLFIDCLTFFLNVNNVRMHNFRSIKLGVKCQEI